MKYKLGIKQQCSICRNQEECDSTAVTIAAMKGILIKQAAEVICPTLFTNKGLEKCELCGEESELRPAGPYGKKICYDCGHKEANKEWLNKYLLHCKIRAISALQGD